MYWLDVDKTTETSTVHRDTCVHAVPDASTHKGVNEMLGDGGWFSFDSLGDAMRFHKLSRLTGRVEMCGVCGPLGDHSPEPMAKLGVRSIKTGCDHATTLTVTDTKTRWRRLTEKLSGK